MNDNKPGKGRIGLVVGVGLTLLLFAGLYFGVEDNPFRTPYLTFSIQFDDVTGIRERSKVMFLGIPAGYVRRLEYAPGTGESAVKVHVVITRKLKIPSTVKAELEPTLLGDASIALRLPSYDVNMDRSPKQDLLSEGAEIRGHRSTKLEAVMPGFDEAMARVEKLGAATEQRLSNIGEAVDNAMGALQSMFLEKGTNGRTEIEELIATLQEIVNGPEGRENESIRAQLETIVSNFKTSSESIKKLANVQGSEQGSIGQMLQLFEDAAKKITEDAQTAQKLINKMGRSSDAVTKAGEQVNLLASKATEAVEQFHSRPFHYLMTTREPAEQNRAPKPTPKQ
jgi:ABC-type transporter Mla subunit MlaD